MFQVRQDHEVNGRLLLRQVQHPPKDDETFRWKRTGRQTKVESENVSNPHTVTTKEHIGGQQK